jgi:hypothetical protein
MLTAAELDADLADMEADMPTVCVITQGKRRQTVAVCSVGEIAAGSALTDEGVFAEDSTPITIRTVSLAWTPTEGATVETAGRKLRVVRVRHVDGDAAITLECEAVTK